MEVATGVLSPVLRKLSELLADEYNLEKRVKKGAKSLLAELEVMHAVLRKIGEVPSDQLDEQVRIWTSKVRDLSFDMEDAVDDFMVHMDESSGGQPMNMKNRVKKFLKKTTKLFSKGKALHQISDAIQEAQELAKELAELREKYKLDMHSTRNGATIDPRVMALHKNADELVGIDHTRDELVHKLIGEDGRSKEHLKIVSVVGVGGLGKTTLTKAVYEKIKAEFDCAAFVPVGRNPDLTKVFKDILLDLDKGTFKGIYELTRDVKQLMGTLHGFLVDKRYLIIIDDIWEEDTWRYINSVLSKNKLCSRVITTTRKVSVSEACLSSTDDMIHKMKSLSDRDSEILFHRRIFSSENKCPEELQKISRDILKKCGGVPLAIITLASILAINQKIKPKNEWFDLLNSIGRGVTKDAMADDMKRILSFSYYDLPSYLKCCLLYLSIFPEDFEIDKDRIIWMWEAEGFIQPAKDEKCRLFEIGESYFDELINRSLIQPARINGEGMVESCRIHDMVLDLICSLSSEENFASILHNAEWYAPNLQAEVRRLSLHRSKGNIENHQFDSTKLSKVRSFVNFSAAASDWLPALSSFKFLRVLHFQNCHGRSGIKLKSVKNLLHLRYLGLNNSAVDELPMDLGKFQLLQILDTRGTRINELPASVVQLRHLICICVDADVRLPKGMKNLTSLEVLKLVVLQLSPHIVKELSHLTELRALKIDWSELDEDQINFLIVSLGNLHKLQNLEIRNEGSSELIDLMREGWMPPLRLRSFDSMGYGKDFFLRLPKWINSTSLPLLSRLVIRVEELQEDGIQIIGMLPALRFLYLGADHTTGELVMTTDAFPSARECEFWGFQTLPCLFPPGSMPKLQCLTFEVSAWLVANGEVNCGMEHLPSLEKVMVKLRNEGASNEDMARAYYVLIGEASAHPKHPTVLTL